jgi:hypothetical protein
MAKYDPLQKYLSRKKDTELLLSFAEIERVIGAMLPRSAAEPQWWANGTNPDTRHLQNKAWRDAGYDAFLLKGLDRVRFLRSPRR